MLPGNTGYLVNIIIISITLSGMELPDIKSIVTIIKQWTIFWCSRCCAIDFWCNGRESPSLLNLRNCLNMGWLIPITLHVHTLNQWQCLLKSKSSRQEKVGGKVEQPTNQSGDGPGTACKIFLVHNYCYRNHNITIYFLHFKKVLFAMIGIFRWVRGPNNII